MAGKLHQALATYGQNPFPVRLKNGSARCAQVVQNPRFHGGLALRFVCNGYCQLPTKKPSARCQLVDRGGVAAGAPLAPPGTMMLPHAMPPATAMGFRTF